MKPKRSSHALRKASGRATRPEALAQRILEFRQGCSALILSDHKPLSPADREWLIEKCQGWAEKLDAQVAAVENSNHIQTVRQEMDETVRNIITTLRNRAKQVS